MKKTSLGPLLFALLVGQTHAAPVEFDTPDAHVIVVRPIDMWSGDKGASEDSLDRLESKGFNYLLYNDGGMYRGGTNVFQGVADYPITLGVESALEKVGASPCNCGNMFHIFEPLSVPPGDMAAVIDSQAALYQARNIAQGDPKTLESRVKVKKLFGGALSLLTFAAFTEKLGINDGLNAAQTLGLPEAVYRTSYQYRGSLIPANLPSLDFTQYKQVDIRRSVYTNAPERIGQIIIAYKTDKTQDAEYTALTKAIVTMLGADTTVAAVEKSRAEDYAARVAIWNSCVAEGKCKAE